MQARAGGSLPSQLMHGRTASSAGDSSFTTPEPLLTFAPACAHPTCNVHGWPAPVPGPMTASVYRVK